MRKAIILYNKLQKILRWSYPGMECYVNDIWYLLSCGASISEIKTKILENDREIGVENLRTTLELNKTQSDLMRLQPYIQRCKNMPTERKYIDIERQKLLEEELNSDLKYADK